MTDSPEPAGAVLVAETRAGKFQVDVTAGPNRFLADEPVAVGGLGSGPDPYELLAAALGSCTSMTVRLYADRKAWPVDRVRVKVAHSRDSQGRDVFDKEIALDGALEEAQVARLLEIAERCPVHLTLQRGSEVRTRIVPGWPGGVDVDADCQHEHDMDRACAEEAGAT